MNRVAVIGLTILACGVVWGYEYDSSDPAQGAGPQATWRAYAQWDTVDEAGTAEIHVHTTDPKYLTPMVSFIPEHSTVPSPRDVLGYIAGTEGKLTHPDETARYFRTLAEASPRVHMMSMGKSEEDRDMWLIAISSEENLSRLDEYKGYTRALSDPRNVSAEQAVEISQKAKPIFLITAGLHSPETGPPEMVMELGYRVAVSEHPDIKEIRDNVIFLIIPVTDVDGRARVVEWNHRYLNDYEDRRYAPSMSPPYWGKYVFHDNNRDGIQLSQKLTQNYLDVFNEWHPVYSLDLHESVPLLYVAGGTGPYNETLDPIVVREWQLLASWELSELQKHNLPGVWTWGFYTGWNPSYLLWITNNRNAMGRFYETFGNSMAATMERDLREASFAGKKVTEKQWYRADPPDEKVTWSLRNNTNYMQSGVLASLSFTARNGSMLLHNYWKKGVNSIEAGKKKDAAKAYAIPREQRDDWRLSFLLNQLLKHGIEVHRVDEDFEVKEGKFKGGDYLVRLDQPYGNFARNLLGDTFFPTDAEHRPYDDVSWKLGLIYGVDTYEIKDAAIFDVAGLSAINGRVVFPQDVAGEAPVYAIKHAGGNMLIRARHLLGRARVFAAEASFEAEGESYPAGTWIIRNTPELDRAVLDRIGDECMLAVHGLAAEPEVRTHEVDLPRLALYHNWISTQDDGWVRYTFDQAGVAYDYINDDDVRAGNLRAKYDVILIADQGGSAKFMVHGRDPKFGAMPYTSTAEYPSHGVIDSSPDITGGIGFLGMANLEEFLNRGGTLMLLGGAGQLATDMGLLRNVSSASGVDTPGSNLQVKVVRRDHPIAYGYEDVDHLFRTNGPLYSVPEEYDHWVVVKYGTKALRDEGDEDEEEAEEEDGEIEADTDESEVDEAEADKDESDEEEGLKPAIDRKKFLLSGFVEGKSRLEESAAILDVPRNAGGRVILYSFNPLHRQLNVHDHNYVYNAILNWNDFPEPEPEDHPGLVRD